KRYSEKAVWFNLVITVIGCIPEIGSLLKGITKIIQKGAKSGKKTPVEELINAFNYFGKGNAVKQLREISAKLPDYGNYAKEKIKEILKALLSWLQQAGDYLPSKISTEAKETKESVEQVLTSVDKQINDVINEVKTKLDKTLNETIDLSKNGKVKTINEQTQVASKPPDSLAKELKIKNLSTRDRYYVEDISNRRFNAEGRVNENGQLDITIRTKLESGERSSNLNAEEQFQKILEHFEGRFESIKGNWQYETNLEMFKKFIKEGFTREQAALKTWTGKQAGKAGYNIVEIIEVTIKDSPKDTVKVIFKKQ
ncbi:MAG TPA: hypothetical protein VD794_14855, partial [Flavisolibacter sp.]|nr:hypothetical protein [Flavisolibacter sp.]